MPQTGVEPALTNVNSDLNAVRLPIPPLRLAILKLLPMCYNNKKIV